VRADQAIQLAVQIEVMHGFFGRPRSGAEERSCNERCFAPRRHNHAVFGAMGSAPPQFLADLAVNARGHKNPAA
jgi:hypothetical protein